MSESAQTLVVTTPLTGSRRWKFASPFLKVWTPSLLDCFFFSLLVWLFAGGPSGWAGLLVDGDAGWHIRTGDYILDTHRIPAKDLFSFSKPGGVWYAWEWLADVLFALLHRAFGLKGVVLLAGVAIPLAMTLLLFHMLRRGANLFVALAVVMLGVGGSSVHYLARPHVLTLLLLAASLFILDRDRLKHSRMVWILIPLAALWTNLHGGFVSIIACTGLVTVGNILAGRWSHAKRYGLLTTGVTLASLLNPYGFHLHLHVFQYLRADWIRNMVEEFQSPSFRNENMLQFEILLFAGLIVTASYVRLRRWPEALLILFWAHMSLGSVRHIPIYCIAAGPCIASGITAWWDRIVSGKPKGSVWTILETISCDLRVSCLRFSPWIALPVIVLACINEPVKWPQDFPKEKFPIALTGRHRDLLSTARVFTSDQWADYLIYRNYPRQRVFLDGRSDYFGPKIAEDYLHLVGGRMGWEKIFDSYKFDVALLPSGWALASLLERQKDWVLVENTGEAILFRRRQVTDTTEPAQTKKESTTNANRAKVNLTGSRKKGRSTLNMSTGKPGLLQTSSMKSSLAALAEAANGESKASEPAGWTLPSGEELVHYALNGGFLAPGILVGAGETLAETRQMRKVRAVQSRDGQSSEEAR